MITLALTPTTATLQGWLVIAMLSLGIVCGLSGLLAVVEEIRVLRRRRREFDVELAQQYEAAHHYCHVVDVAGTPVRIQSDRPVSEYDMWVVDEVLRTVAVRAEEMTS